MSYILEFYDTDTEAWIDISDRQKKDPLHVELDVLGTYEIEYSGKTMEIKGTDITIENGDYVRFRKDEAPSNFMNILKGIDTTFDAGTAYNWINGPSNIPIWNIDTTVTDKLFFKMNNQTFCYLALDLPKTVMPGKTYRVRVKARYRSGSGATIAFGNDNADGSAYFEVDPTGSEDTYEGTFVALAGNNYFYIMAFAPSSNTSEFEIDDLELYVESDAVIYSGNVNNLIQHIREDKYTFDLDNDVKELKEKDIGFSFSGSNLRQRLMDAMPDNYVLVEMDDVAESMLNVNESAIKLIFYPGDYIVIGSVYFCIQSHRATSLEQPGVGANWEDYWTIVSSPWSGSISYIYGDLVTGSDAGIYTCIQNHTSTVNDTPITGANWEDYWVLVGTYSGETWLANTDYNGVKFNDILYDTLKIANADSQGNNYLYCVVVNREIRMYGKNVNSTGLALTASLINEIEANLTEEIVTSEYNDLIMSSLRGTAPINLYGSTAKTDWKKTTHKIATIQALDLMTLISYNSFRYGFIISIEQNGAMYKYGTLKLEAV